MPTLCDPNQTITYRLFIHGDSPGWNALEWLPFRSSRGSSQLRDWTHVMVLLHWTGSSSLGSPIMSFEWKYLSCVSAGAAHGLYSDHGILRQNTGWVAFPFSGSSHVGLNPGLRIADGLTSSAEPQGSAKYDWWYPTWVDLLTGIRLGSPACGFFTSWAIQKP